MESQPKRKVRGDMNKFDMMSKDAMNRMEEIMNSTRLNEFLHRKEEEDKKKNVILWVLAILGAVAAVAAKTEEFTFLSSGTWSLMGISSKKLLEGEAIIRSKISNEGTADGRVGV